MSPSGSQVRYQRVVASTSASTPAISSSCGASVDALEALDDLPARVRAGHLARDPEGAHDVGRLGAALGHSWETNVGPSALTTALALTMQISCAAQRVLGQQVRRSA